MRWDGIAEKQGETQYLDDLVHFAPPPTCNAGLPIEMRIASLALSDAPNSVIKNHSPVAITSCALVQMLRLL